MPTYFLKGEIVGEFSSRNFYQKIFHQDRSSLTLTIVLHLFLFPHQDKKKDENYVPSMILRQQINRTNQVETD